jgi:hypothetical protein
MAQPARPYTPEFTTDDVFNDRDPSNWAYHIRVKREKEAMEYSEAKATEICERVSAGEFLINILKDEDLPTVRRCNQWLKEHSDFKALYDEAINDRLSIFEDEVVTIPDEAAKDYEDIVQKNGETRSILDPTKISGAKLRVEVRFRHLRACKPQKWGDSSTIITKSEGDDFSNMTLEELENKIHDLTTKNNIVKGVA